LKIKECKFQQIEDGDLLFYENSRGKHYGIAKVDDEFSTGSVISIERGHYSTIKSYQWMIDSNDDNPKVLRMEKGKYPIYGRGASQIADNISKGGIAISNIWNQVNFVIFCKTSYVQIPGFQP